MEKETIINIVKEEFEELWKTSNPTSVRELMNLEKNLIKRIEEGPDRYT